VLLTLDGAGDIMLTVKKDVKGVTNGRRIYRKVLVCGPY
jgi:hypothetical protein